MKAKTNRRPAISPDERYTYKEYKTWPEGERWELIEGVAYAMSPAPMRLSVLEGFSWTAEVSS